MHLEYNLTLKQVDWFFKRLRSKKRNFKPTFYDLTFEEEQLLLFHLEYCGKNPSQLEINNLARSIGRSDSIVTEWFKLDKRNLRYN
jgi:hypothetical protein